MSPPRVTVLMAVHNGSALIGQAIESVLAQTLSDLELLIVDDASTDPTVEIVRSYPDPRIRLLQNERNVNQVVSLNRGLQEARSGYVARIDHDDLALPSRLERQAALLDSKPDVGVAGTWMDIRDLDGELRDRLTGRVSDYPDFVFALLTERELLGHPSVMFRRDAVLALGGYDESMRWAEDLDLWTRLALGRWSAAVIEEPLVVYRWHARQQSSTSRDLQHAARARALERYAAALAGEEHARILSLLLGRRPDLLGESDPRRAPQALDALLAGAKERLRLSDAEARRFESLVRARMRHLALRAWKLGPDGQRQVGGPLWGWVGGRPAVQSALTAAAPALYTTRRVRIRVTDSVHASRHAHRLKRIGRRSEHLTRLYRRVVSDR